jgi:hypothetical protein
VATSLFAMATCQKENFQGLVGWMDLVCPVGAERATECAIGTIGDRYDWSWTWEMNFQVDGSLA